MRILMVALGLCAGTSICGAQQPAATPAPATASATEAAQPAPVAAVVVPPEAPVTPAKVVCAGDEITISANNSTLSSVLNEVHRCMGTKIDIPMEAGSKRLFDKIGPGKASQVLDLLLSNTGYNYIIGSSPANEDKIESIVLLSRTPDASGPAVLDDARTGSTSRRAFSQMHQASIPHPMTEADEAAAAELLKAKEAPAAPAENATAPADAQQPAAPATDATPKPAEAAPAQPDNSATPPAPTQPATASDSYSTKPNTTEQQIVNMQQMFELRKQMTQQQNQPPPPQP